MSIRLRILAVLSVMLALACGLAFYAIRGITRRVTSWSASTMDR